MAINKTNLEKILEELKTFTSLSEQVIEKFGVEEWNWGLHPILGPEGWNFSRDINKNLYFDPNPFTKEALEEYESTKSKGSWGYAAPNREHNILKANKKEKKISILTSLSDPRVTYALKTSAEHIPELMDYDVIITNYFSKNENSAYTNVGKLQDLLQNIKKISGKSPTYSKQEEQFKQFEYEVFKDISEHTWYHATRESNLSSINEKGLLPSKEVTQGSGWTEFNFNLQNAVYLTANKDYAENIATTLSERYEESAIVLKINGEALKDYSKLIVDEDSLRNEYTDKVEAGAIKQGMADYLTSVTDTIQSIGYKDRIAPEYISVEKTIVFNSDEESDNAIKENKRKSNFGNISKIIKILENLF